jgi:hypothetical protein
MQQPEARRSTRIAYQSSVELIAQDFDSAVVGRAVDLGTGGIGVAAAQRIPIGAAVTCCLTLDGRSATLPGRVAWGRTQDAATPEDVHDMGICFEPLPGYEADVIKHVVQQSEQGYRAIELHFAGLERPVVARARAHTDGLRLSAALPILARGTELTFQLDQEGPLFTGQVADAAIREHDGMRRLDIEVHVGRQDRVRFRRQARYGNAGEIDAPLQAPADPIATSSSPSEPSPRRLAGARSRRIIELVLAVLTGAGLSWFAITARPAPARSVHGANARPTEAAPRTPLRPPPVQASAVVTPQPVQSPSLTRETVSAPPAEIARPASPARPAVQVEGRLTRLRIPFSGSLDSVRARIWAQPHSLAIDLPDGHSSLLPGQYGIALGSASTLRLRIRGTETLLRIALVGPIKRYSLAAQDGSLEVQLEQPATGSPDDP